MISFLFLSRAASRWLAHRREHMLLGNPGSLSALQSGKPLHLNPIRLSLMSLFTFLPIPPALGQSPFKGYLYFRLKQSCFFHGRLSVQQYHTVPRVGAHFLPTFPFSGFTLPPFGLFTQSRSVTSSLAALHPLPWPGTISAVPQGWRAGAVLPSSSLHPACWEGTWCSILWSHIPTHAPTPPLCPAPRGVQWQLRRDPSWSLWMGSAPLILQSLMGAFPAAQGHCALCSTAYFWWFCSAKFPWVELEFHMSFFFFFFPLNF